MLISRYAASNPDGQRLLVFIEISHPTWPDVLRYGEDVQDWTVTLEDESEATFPAMGLDAALSPVNDTGDDSIPVRVPDADGVLWRRFEALRGYLDEVTLKPVPVRMTLRLYLSTDLSAPAAVLRFAVGQPQRAENRDVSFTASNADLFNRDVPVERFTWRNSPGLRR